MGEQSLIPTISKELHSAYDSYMSSEIFELVAENEVTFFVHKDLLGFHSRPFKEATSGVWKESTERKILLRDWDAKTVGRLVQFLYTGDYKYPDPFPTDVPISSAKEELLPNMPDTADIPQNGTLTPFEDYVEGAIHQHAQLPMTDSMWLEQVDTCNFNFEETFLAHAKIYVLAQYKSIPTLKALAHARLARTLLKLHPLGGNLHLSINIVNLATYVYSNTDSLTHSEEPLRKLISQYVALNFVTWQTELSAVEMMCSGGDFVRDVLTKYCRRFGYRSAQGLAPPGTRYIESFDIVKQSVRPSECIPELDSSTGKEKHGTRTIWLIPHYTTDANMATTHFHLSQSAGLRVSNILGKSCGSNCHFWTESSKDLRDKVIDMAFIQSSNPELDVRRFREFDGIISHTAHIEDNDNIHILWKTIKTSPV